MSGTFPRQPHAFRRATRGSVSLLVAVSITSLLGLTDLALEYGLALVQQVHNQRVADSAAYAGALAYANAGTSAAMQTAASAVARLNGSASGTATATLVASPRGNGNSAVLVTLTSPYQVVITHNALTITELSFVELTSGAPPCVIALNGSGTGIALSGGTSLSTSSCAVASNASLQVPCGTTLATDVATWNTTAPSVGCNGIVPVTKSSTSIKQVHTADPFASNSGIATAVARLSFVATMTSPAAPAVSGGTNLDFGYTNGAKMSTGTACIASHQPNGSVWTVTCPAGGTYNFGSLTLEGGITVAFDTAGTNSTYNFAGLASGNGAASLTFGSGTFNFAAGLSTSQPTSFGSGTFNIGRGATSCGDYSICNTSSGTGLTIAGPASIKLQAGLYNGGGSTVSIGAGSSANSYVIGAGSSGNAINNLGGANLTLGDATGSTFQAAGTLNFNGGGGCVTMPVAAQHDVYGSIIGGSGTLLGSGVYTITGYVDLGGSGGGDFTCNGQQVGFIARDSTLIIGASRTPGDSCSGQAFCVAAGFGHVAITAPTTGPYANLAVVGPFGGNTAGASFQDGATNTAMSGLFYFPGGPMVMGGAATIQSNGACLELVASQITLTGGSAAATVCPGFGSTSSSNVATLVQ